MSSELDVPLTPSADQIRRREFVTVRRGYDPEQVRAYLARVAEQVEVLEELARTTRSVATTKQGSAAEAPAATETAAPAQEPQVPADPYVALSAHMAELLRNAEETATRIVAEAEAECSRIMAEAGADADRIRTDAQGNAEAVRQEADRVSKQARQEADQLLQGLDSRRDQLVEELQMMREKLLGMAQGLGSLAVEHEASLIRIPPAEPEPDAQYAELWDEGGGASQAAVEEKATEAVSDPEPPRFIDPSPPTSGPVASMDPLDRLFADIPTLSLEDLDPGEFNR